MAKSLRIKDYSIYPYRGVKSSKTSTVHYLNIRVIDVKKKAKDNGKFKPIDLALYTENGERIKVDSRFWHETEHRITGGYERPKVDELNARISDVVHKIYDHIRTYDKFTMQTIETIVYGKRLLANAKNKRNVYLSVPIYQRRLTYEFKEVFDKLKNHLFENGVQENLETIAQLTVAKVINDKTVEDILNGTNAISFVEANNYLQKINSFITDFSFYRKIIDLKKSDPQLKDELMSMFASSETSNVLYVDSIKKMVNITKDESKILKDRLKQRDDNRSYNNTDLAYEKMRKEDERKLIERKKKNPFEIYSEGAYNKDNIFEILGQILFLNKGKSKEPYSKNWKTTYMLFIDWYSNEKPNTHINDLTIEWIESFLYYIKEKGYSTFNPRSFNPFNFDEMKFIESERKKYTDTSLQKYIKNTKEIFDYFGNNNLLPLLPIKKIAYEDFGIKKVKDDTKVNFYLTKKEIDKLLFYKFEDKELERTRDLFILQYYFGGLRPKEELLAKDTVKILDDDNGGKKVSYIISKDSGEVNENPICSYSDIILKKYDYNFEKVKDNFDYKIYSEKLKTIGQMLFDRVVVRFEQHNGKITQRELNIKDEFTAYFARRSFEMTLKSAGVNQVDTSAFTGRKLNVGSLKNYRHFTYQDKRDVMGKIEPERT